MRSLILILLICLSLNPHLLIGKEKGENEHIKLLIKIPTRNRFERFFNALDKYYEKLSKEISYHFIITCDEDDPIMNSQEAIDKLQTYPHLSYYFGNSQSKIEACNKDIDPNLDFDILLLGSDDMMPIIDNYDKIIVTYMEKYFPDYDGVLHFNDGQQGPKLNTLSILGKKYYMRFGYIYYPGYRSFFCDLEFMMVSQMLNKAIYIDTVIIEHQHYLWGKSSLDELYIINNKDADHDRELFYKRAQSSFDL